MEYRPKKYADFAEFLREIVLELNHLSREGAVVLVEGRRDVSAMREVGYSGRILSVSSLTRGGAEQALNSSDTVIILTDLDREGGLLAAKYSKILKHRGHRVSLEHRKRLLAASRGVFRHVENFKRFGESLGADGLSTHKSKSLYQ